FSPGGDPTNLVPASGLFHIRIGIDAPRPIPYPSIGIGFDDSTGQRTLTVHTPRSRVAVEGLEGRCLVDCRIAALPLARRVYWVKLALAAAGKEIDAEERALHFTVVDGELFGEGVGFHRGVCIAPSAWNLVPETVASA